MQNKRQLKVEQTNLQDLKIMVDAYQEIAATRMRKVKKSVLQNRDFLSGLSDLYKRVRNTYMLTTNKKHTAPLKSKNLRETNDKTVSVLISANTGLYGDIIKRTYDFFYDSVKNNNNDLVIIGRIGKQMYENAAIKRAFRYFDSSDASTNVEYVKEVLKYLIPYANIVVYHELYVSILNQVPKTTFVTGQAVIADEKTKIEELKCLIEPSIEEVLSFFEQQILSSLFEQSMYEASLSKFSSRMVSLDYASENINKYIKHIRLLELKLMHQTNNLKQMELMSGITLWK